MGCVNVFLLVKFYCFSTVKFLRLILYLSGMFWTVKSKRRYFTKGFFVPMPPYVHIDFVVPTPGCGRSVTIICGWGAHRAQLRCPDDVSDYTYIWAWSTRKDLKPKFYRLPRPWSLWGSSPARENPHGRTGNRNRDLMFSRSSDYQATRLVSSDKCNSIESIPFHPLARDQGWRWRDQLDPAK
jgi:hypothetical protein